MEEQNQFNPTNFDFSSKPVSNEKSSEKISFTDNQKRISIILYVISFLLTSFFLVYSLIYVTKSPYFDYESGGIGEFGHFSIGAFFILVDFNILILATNLLIKNNIYKSFIKRLKLISSYFLGFSLILLFSSVVLRKDICSNSVVNIWSHYGSFVIILFTLLFVILSFVTRYIKNENTLKNINSIIILSLSIFIISHYSIMHTSIVISPNNMWTIIIGCILGVVSSILLFNSNKGSKYIILFEVSIYAALFFVVFGLIRYGCEMSVSIPHILY